MPNVAKSRAFFESENSPPPSPGIDGTGRGGTRRRWPPRSSPRGATGAAWRCTRARDTGVLRSPISTVVECSPSRPPAMRVRPSSHAYWYPCWEERRPIAREGLRPARRRRLDAACGGRGRGASSWCSTRWFECSLPAVPPAGPSGGSDTLRRPALQARRCLRLRSDSAPSHRASTTGRARARR